MNDREYRRWKKRIERHIDYWVPRMLLQDWTRTITWHRTSDGTADGAYGVAMQITSHHEYMSLYLEVFLPWFHDQELEDWRIDQIVIHELHHAILSELRAHVPDHEHDNHMLREEHVNSVLTTILLNQTTALTDNGRWWEKRAKRWKRRARKAARRAAV